MSDATMNVVFDNIAFSLQKVGGVSEYWGRLLKAYDVDPEINLAVIERADADSNLLRKSMGELASPVMPSRFANVRLDEISRLKVDADEPTIFHSSYFRTAIGKNIINVTTVHDFIAEKYFTGFLRAFSLWQIRRAVKRSDAVICISESTKRDLLRLVPEAAGLPLRIVNQGYDTESYRFDPALAECSPLPQAIFIGRRDLAHKNFKAAVEAVAENGRVKLVIVGAPLTANECAYLDATVPGRYEAQVYPSTNEVAAIYSRSLCLLYPSGYEGFGLPVLEGMACGVPVIALNCSSIPEVAGDAALLIDEASPSAISCLIDRLMDDKDTFEGCRARGLRNAERFSWDRTAHETKSFYRDILNARA